jgi:predicted ester cyclase
MAIDNQQLARKIYACFNDHDLDGLAQLAAPGCAFTDMATGLTFEGPAGFADSAQRWFSAFSDARLEISNQVVHGDFLVTELVGRGTHDGPLDIPGGGTIGPTGKQAELSCCEVLRVSDGQVQSGRLYYDALTLLEQLGVAPELPAEQPIA